MVAKLTGSKRKAKRPEPTAIETGTLYVNGSCLGPAECDPATGRIESGPHVTARAAVSGMAVLRVDRSPMNPKRWVLTLACNHEVWVTSTRKPTQKTSPCTTCATWDR